ncbi:MAG TPA: carboxy terminal-processing peptidase [Rhodanobacteraceae bacterium]|nr:carboxy terminal-processing peptidase [Rhodanobacteraceae bacterium]
MNRLFRVAAGLALGLCAGVALAATSCPKPDTETIDLGVATKPLHAEPSQREASTLVANLMTRYHYDAVPLDDSMSKKIFKAYLDALDSQKMFFTQADIDRFGAARTSLDDAIWNGDLKVPFDIFNTYAKRLTSRTAKIRALLDKGFDFTLKESYTYDRSKADWASSEAALDELWRKRVKNDWLRLKLAGKKDADIRSTLDKRYATYLERVRQLDSEDVFQSFMNAYAESVDPHTNFFDPRTSQNFNITMKLSLEGIGAVLERHDEYTQIRQIVPGGPAAESGKLQAGDRIVGVAQDDCAMVDVVGWRLDDVVDLIRGHKNTVVRLEILPAGIGPDGKRNVVRLVRKKVAIENSAAKKSIIEITRDGHSHKVGVIDLPSFYQDFGAKRRGDANYRSATRDVAELLGELKKAGVEGVIVDLRSDGGGSLSEAASLTGLFINKGPVVQVRNTRGKVEEESDDNPGTVWSGPLAVLVNRGSASASEIFTAAIQDYHRGLVIGSNTFGKGTVQNLVNLDQIAHNEEPVLGSLKMTIAQFFRVDGGSTQLRGVTPDIVFPSGIDPEDLGESSYPNALPWSSISPASYTPVNDIDKSLVAELDKAHEARIADNVGWKVQVAEMRHSQALRDRTTVSLNLEERTAERDANNAFRKKLEAQAKAAEEAEDKDNNVRVAVDGSVAKPASAALVPAPAATDDGLQPGERSVHDELAKERAEEQVKDVRLIEAANIVADLAHAKAPANAPRIVDKKAS